MCNRDERAYDDWPDWPARGHCEDAFAIPESGAVRIFNGLMRTSLSSVEEIQAYLDARPEERERFAGAR